jgi:unsaturated chondroitin disaccharide hydrolase
MPEEQYREVLQLLSRKLMEDEATLGVSFPYVTAPNGSWEVMPASLSAGYRGADWSHGNWFCGFWIGLHLAAYLQTGNEKHREIAEERLRLIAIRAEDGNTHDIGFIFSSSAVIAHHITGNAVYRDLALKAASQLRRRTIVTEKGAYISAWGPLDDPRGRRSSAIDTMANLPLLYWAAAAGRDESYLLAVNRHLHDRQYRP